MARCAWPHPCEEEPTVRLQMLVYCEAHAKKVEANRAELRQFQALDVIRRRLKPVNSRVVDTPPL